MPSPYCTYLQNWSLGTPANPPGNCFTYSPNEWMTFQVHIHTGNFVTDEWQNSHVDMWVSREGQPSVQVFNYGPTALSAGTQGELFGKVWLLPYHTGKDSTQVHPTAYTWYDELIISRNKIADPGTTPPPTTLLGDLNNDRTVNGFDWTIMEGQWGTANSQSDLNSDGIVNSIDFSLMNANWGRTI